MSHKYYALVETKTALQQETIKRYCKTLDEAKAYRDWLKETHGVYTDIVLCENIEV